MEPPVAGKHFLGSLGFLKITGENIWSAETEKARLRGRKGFARVGIEGASRHARHELAHGSLARTISGNVDAQDR